MPKHWLMKTEPDVFSIADLKKAKQQTTYWDGVRNYQARNFMRDDMKIGDFVLIYHSNADPSCVVGIAKISREAYPISLLGTRKIPISTPNPIQTIQLGSWSISRLRRFSKSPFR